MRCGPRRCGTRSLAGKIPAHLGAKLPAPSIPFLEELKAGELKTKKKKRRRAK